MRLRNLKRWELTCWQCVSKIRAMQKKLREQNEISRLNQVPLLIKASPQIVLAAPYVTVLPVRLSFWETRGE